MNSILADFELAINANTTYLVVAEGAATDAFLNPVVVISPNNALRVTTYVPDTTSPQISSVVLNLEMNTLELSVNEPIIPSSFNTSQISIVNSDTAPTVSYTLTGGDVEVNGLNIVVTLNNEDVSFLKRNSSLGTSAADTFIVASPLTFTDASNNLVEGIPPNMPRTIDNFVEDTSPPRLVSFSYEAPGDRAGVVLQLTFSEVIDTSSLNASMITLTDAPGSTTIVILTNGSFNLRDSNIVALNVSDIDYNRILAMPPIGTSINTTYLSIAEGAVVDLVNLPLEEITDLPAAAYTVDLVSPEISNFTFDLNAGTLSLTFSEIIPVDTYNSSQVTILLVAIHLYSTL